jgi:hypothetical protein
MSNSSQSSGISFGSLLFLVFLVLKLTHIINWSWWWVTSPLWISAIIIGIVVWVTYSYFLGNKE